MLFSPLLAYIVYIVGHHMISMGVGEDVQTEIFQVHAYLTPIK